jgi:hypothetical protein
LKELKRCFKVFLYFLSIGIPYYKEGHVDEVKITKSSDSKSFPKLSQTETPSQTLSGPIHPYLRKPQTLIESHNRTMSGSPLDFVWILNLGPTTRFLREPYINTSTSNGSPLLGF